MPTWCSVICSAYPSDQMSPTPATCSLYLLPKPEIPNHGGFHTPHTAWAAPFCSRQPYPPPSPRQLHSSFKTLQKASPPESLPWAHEEESICFLRSEFPIPLSVPSYCLPFLQRWWLGGPSGQGLVLIHLSTPSTEQQPRDVVGISWNLNLIVGLIKLLVKIVQIQIL